MIVPVMWTEVPNEFKVVVWKGQNNVVKDAPGIFNPQTGMTVFLLELDNNDRRQLIEGNPIYMTVCGPIPPFGITANLGEALDLARSE